MSNVTVFPCVQCGPRGRWWYGGRGFKTKEALQASLTESDKKCIALWNYYRFGTPLTCVDAVEGSAA
jgi:hypothetical protein